MIKSSLISLLVSISFSADALMPDWPVEKLDKHADAVKVSTMLKSLDVLDSALSEAVNVTNEVSSLVNEIKSLKNEFEQDITDFKSIGVDDDNALDKVNDAVRKTKNLTSAVKRMSSLASSFSLLTGDIEAGVFASVQQSNKLLGSVGSKIDQLIALERMNDLKSTRSILVKQKARVDFLKSLELRLKGEGDRSNSSKTSVHTNYFKGKSFTPMSEAFFR